MASTRAARPGGPLTFGRRKSRRWLRVSARRLEWVHLGVLAASLLTTCRGEIDLCPAALGTLIM